MAPSDPSSQIQPLMVQSPGNVGEPSPHESYISRKPVPSSRSARPGTPHSYQSLPKDSGQQEDQPDKRNGVKASFTVSGEESSLPSPKKRYRTIRAWTWEILAVLLAIGLMLAKVGILLYFEGQRLPEWPLSINLNTLIALFSIIQRAAILLVLAEIIGQAKWTWLTERDRPVYHVEEFNDASRSTLGAMQLFYLGISNRAHAGLKSLVLSAALVTVLSLLIGPFTQQAINQQSCRRLTSSGTASVPVAHYFSGTNDFSRDVIHTGPVDTGMKAVMLTGLMDPGAQDTAVQAQCSTGECAFPDHGTGVTYSSIGMCSRCLDTTSLVPYPDKDLNLTLYDGITLDFNTLAQLTINATDLQYAEKLFTDDFEEDLGYSALNITVMAVSDKGPVRYRNQGVVATSCIFYPCLESYHGSVSEGILNEKLVSREHVLPNDEDDVTSDKWWFKNHDTALKSPCVLDDGTWYTARNISDAPPVPDRDFLEIRLDGRDSLAPQECLYAMYRIYRYRITDTLEQILQGNCSSTSESLNCGNNWWLDTLHNSGNATADSISAHIESMTTAITNRIRKTGHGTLTIPPGQPLAARAEGETYQGTTCTVVDWRWLIAPVIFVAATALLLAWTVLRGRLQDTAQPAWKSSVVPLLFYGLQDLSKTSAPLSQPDHLADWSELKKLSKQSFIRFENGSRGLDPGFHAREGDSEAIDLQPVSR